MIDIKDHIGLATKMAQQFRWATGAHLDFEDLVQVALLGLHVAAQRFDASRGYRFSTYAAYWIQCHLRCEVNDNSRTIRTPRSARRKLWKQGTISPPHGYSLDEVGENSKTWVENLEGEESTSDQEKDMLLGELREHIEKLSDPMSRNVLKRVYLKEEMVKDVASDLGLSRQQVKVICDEMIQKLSEKMR